MPVSNKVLGQANPTASTSTVLYTVPASTQAVGSTLVVCNLDTTGVIATYSIAVVPSGQTLANKHYTHYTQAVDARKSVRLTLGWTLAAGDKVYILASTANVAFNLFGSELT
jgi:hypothetical protein